MTNDIIIYKDTFGNVKANVLCKDENIWLTQIQIAKLFDTTKQNISLHIQNIFKENELQEKATVKDFLTVQNEGQRKVSRNITYYNLDMIIAVGYRVNSKKATAFRIWATGILKEFMIKGFVLDDERLKNGQIFGKDYFRELLERIRDIRASEKRLYQQLKDIYALSADYSKSNKDALLFFKKVQNKVHFAVTGKTAPEIIFERSNLTKPNMGLTSWKNSPNGKITKADVIIAKNYLDDKELQDLKIIINMFLDYAELQTKNNNLIYMKDWEQKLDNFIKFNEKQLLKTAGKISEFTAKKRALSKYAEYKELMRLEEKKNSLKEFETDIKELEEILKKD